LIILMKDLSVFDISHREYKHIAPNPKGIRRILMETNYRS
jgi:hypothetical protein